MKNYYKTVILVVTFALVTVRCDDFVDVNPPYTLDAEN